MVIAAFVVVAFVLQVVVPKGPDSSSRTTMEVNILQIVQGLYAIVALPGNENGFPPAYGYLRREAMGKVVERLSDSDHVLTPYTDIIGIHGYERIYQLPRWTPSFEADRKLALFEYLPVGQPSSSGDGYVFSDALYTGSNTPHSGELNEVTTQRESGRLRPYVYVPFNKQQLAVMVMWWTERGDALGEQFDGEDPALAALVFPPSVYDGFVLIGNGPGGTDGGLSALPPPGIPGEDYNEHYVYHVLGLRIAFLATRDWTPGPKPEDPPTPEPDESLDFDFRARRVASRVTLLPDGTNGHGATIKVVQ